MNKIFSEIFVLLVICFVVKSDDDGCPTIKTRSRWGGRSSLLVHYQVIPVQYVIIHHTVSPTCSTFFDCASQVRAIQGHHMNGNKWNDIGYNFLIGNDGNVYEGVGWHQIGAHTYGYNSKSIGIAFIGDFREELPSPSALDAAKKLLQCGVNKGELDRRYRLFGALQLSNTESPGLKLYNEIQDWNNWSSSE